jgi:ABC-type nitrate/sulfonate/bicarbonate transport system substrate-binding protein
LLATAASAQAANQIEFGTTGRTDANMIATYIALEKKMFEAEGLSIDWIAAGSAGRAAQQTVAGSLNISTSATDQTIRAISEGAPLKIIGGAVTIASFRTVGAKDIQNWSQLKGKTISVGGASDQTLFFFRVMARKNNLGDHDYDLVYGGTTPARFSQLMSGAVGAAVLIDPQDIAAINMGYTDLGFVPDYVPVWAQVSVYVNAPWAQAHHADVVAFLRALRKATSFFYDPKNEDETLAVMMKYTGADRPTAEHLYHFYVERQVVAHGATISEKGVQAVVDSLVQMGSLSAPLPLGSLVDTSYFSEASQ